MTAFGSALLVTGSEQLLASRAVDGRQRTAAIEQPGADVNRVNALELGTSMLSEVVGGSLFSSHIIAIIDDVGATPPEVVDQLVAVAKNPGDELCLILIHEGGNKGKGLIDKLKKAKIETESVVAPKAFELPKFCQQEARRLKVSLGQDGAQALVSAVGADLRALVSAVSQLADDAGGERSTPSLFSGTLRPRRSHILRCGGCCAARQHVSCFGTAAMGAELRGRTGTCHQRDGQCVSGDGEVLGRAGQQDE